ncbi:hypothetical protein L7G72_12785 [Xenorhabdus bovienii]|uniref:hypothetical protein n=1 Tax=Xenorhabdus bovienii TaxID=40576 RepID=UPI001EDCE1B8|nr:hypothetical protein [Xenorhabdus bovienii]MCG3462716.1 hypothetical protein [Xenorhabdus bovienii]
MERKEKIAFIYPAAQDKNGNEGPTLHFQCDELPIDTKIAIAAAFVGLRQSEKYLISLDVVDKNGITILKESPDKLPVGIPVTADDIEAEPNDVPGFLNVSLLSRITITGVHTIRISIASANEPSKILHETEARFRVILRGEWK